MKFRYVGDETYILHPDLGIIDHYTVVEPSDPDVIKKLEKDKAFKKTNDIPERPVPTTKPHEGAEEND